MMRKTRAVLFDLDDTLVHIPKRLDARDEAVDWEPVTRAQVKLLSSVIGADVADKLDLFGFLASFWSEYASRYPEPRALMPPLEETQWQQGERLLGQMMRSQLGVSTRTTECWRSLFQVNPDAFGRACFPDAFQTLTTLREMELHLCVVTNRIAPSDLVKTELEALGLDAMFDAVLSAGEVGFRKPHTKLFERALDILGARAVDTVMVGDNYLLDIEPAVRMGMTGVWKHNRRQRPVAINPAIVHIDALHEVIQVVAHRHQEEDTK